MKSPEIFIWCVILLCLMIWGEGLLFVLLILVLYFRYYICFKWSLFVKEEEKTSKIGLFFEGLPSHRWKMGRKGKKNDSLQEFKIQHFNALAMMCYFVMFNDLRWGVIVRFVDIGGIVDHRCLNFLSRKCWSLYQ
jgi:hypothetical protein